MDQPQVGRSGFKVPVLSVGTGTFGGGGIAFFERRGQTEDAADLWSPSRLGSPHRQDRSRPCDKGRPHRVGRRGRWTMRSFTTFSMRWTPSRGRATRRSRRSH